MNNESIVSPEVGKFQLFVEVNPKLANTILSRHVSKDVRKGVTPTTTSGELIAMADKGLFEDSEYTSWDKSDPIADTPIDTLEQIEETQPEVDMMNAIKNAADVQNKSRAEEIVFKLAEVMQNKTGVSSKTITPEEATVMLATTTTPYNNQPSFFYDGVNYFIDGKATLELVFHEYCHPIVASVRVANPVLFDNLYNEVAATKEGEEIIAYVNKEYPTLSADTPRFKEEVIVHALERKAINTSQITKILDTSSQPSPQFNSIIEKIMFHIKQWFRKNFGKVKIEKLKVDTTLDELSELITNESFKIDLIKVTDKDIAMFAAAERAHVDELVKAIEKANSQSGLQLIIDKLNIMIKVQETGLKSFGFGEARTIIGKSMSKMSERLRTAQSLNLTDAQQKAHENLTVAQQASSLVSTLGNLDFAVKDILKELTRIKKTDTSKMTDAEAIEHNDKSLALVQYYSKLLNEWNNFVDISKKDMAEAGIPQDSTMKKFMANLGDNIETGLELYGEIQEEGTVNLYNEWVKESNKKRDTEFNARKKELDAIIANSSGMKKETAVKALKAATDKHQKYFLSKDKIRDMIQGKIGDASWWSTMFESYTTNPDPIVGGFAKFIKDTISNIEAEAIRNEMAFMAKISPLLKELNITGTNLEKTWDFALSQDSTFEKKDGVYVEKKVLSFVAPTISGRWKIKQLEVEIEKAKEGFAKIKSELLTKGVVPEDLLNNKEYKNAQEILRVAYKDLSTEKTNFWWQDYDKEVYEAQDELLKTDIGLAAWLERNEVLAKISAEANLMFSEYENFEEADNMAERWKEYAQLYSIHNANGTMKTGDDLLKAEALNAHRRRTSKYYKYVDKKEAFNSALSAFEDDLISNKGLSRTSTEYKELVDKWIAINTVPGFTEEYWNDVAKTFLDLDEWMAKLPPAIRQKLDVTAEFTEMGSLVMGYKDALGQPDGTMVPDKKMAELKRVQEALINKEDVIKKSGILASLSVEMLEERTRIFDMLAQLRGKEATTHYIDQVNTLLDDIKGVPYTKLTSATASDFIKGKGVGDTREVPADRVMARSPEFKKWFMANHVRREYVNNDGELVHNYQRLSAWSSPSPKLLKHLTTFKYQVTNPETGEVEEKTMTGRTPSMKYKTRVVRDQFRTIPYGMDPAEKTRLYVGVRIDNKGNFLPKNKEDYAKKPAKDPITGKVIDSPYINKKYYEIPSAKHAELLKYLKEYHLANQKDLDYKSRLYLDLPRMRIGSQRNDTLEQMQSGRLVGEKVKTLKKLKEGVTAFAKGASREEVNAITREAGDFEEGTGDAAMDETLHSIDFMNSISEGSVIDRLPVSGTSNMELEETSRDVLRVLNVYGMSAEKQRQFTKINHIAKAILNTVNNPKNKIKKDGLDMAKGNSLKRKILSKKDNEVQENIRASGMNALYDREFKGKIYSERHLDWLNKVTGKLMKGASFSYFALNLPSATKNYWGALWQMRMLAAAGEHMSPGSYLKAKVWSIGAQKDWMNHIYGGDNYTLNNQMLMFFDPLQGKLSEVFGSHASRSKEGDIASLSWMYSPRKFMELEASFQLFGGMMLHKKVEKNVNGKIVEIPYMEAFEIDPVSKLMVLNKDIVDREYEVGGRKYLDFKNLIHEQSKNLNGAFAKFESPQAQAHFAYRLVMFMRRYFTSMFMARFAKQRGSIITNDVTTGFYVESIKNIGKIIGSYGHYINMMEPSEKAAMKKLLTEVSTILIISAITSLMFGYDDDDPDRWKKMKARSGAIGDEDFHLDGFLANHLLVMLLKTSNENETFIPLPGFGLNDYTRMSTVTSVAFGPTITTYAQLLTDIAMHAKPGEDESLFYKREAGPYPWQQKGSAKIWNHIFRTAGLTGSDVDIIKGGKSFTAMQSRF
jgi:hypothetical protein